MSPTSPAAPVHGREGPCVDGDDTVIRYRVGADDRLVAVGGRWDDFALSGGAPELAGDGVIGRSLWDFVADERSRAAYRSLLERVRGASRPLTLRLRCDSPAVRRSIELTLAPAPEGEVEFVSRTLAEANRDPVELLDPAVVRSPDLLLACSWCQRVEIEGAGWMEVEMVLEGDPDRPLPRLSHGMCPDCWERAVDDLDDEARP